MHPGYSSVAPAKTALTMPNIDPSEQGAKVEICKLGFKNLQVSTHSLVWNTLSSNDVHGRTSLQIT